MKKIFILYGFITGIFCLINVVAQAQNCPAILFTYDEAGNRIQRVQGTVPGCFAALRDSRHPVNANVYPNPAYDKLNIELQKDETAPEATISLYDMIGKELYSTKTNSLQIQVDVSQFGAGYYLLRVVRGAKSSTYNISKN